MTYSLPPVSIAEQLADRIVAIRFASLGGAMRTKCEDLAIDVAGLCPRRAARIT
jgi:hypothetical protein